MGGTVFAATLFGFAVLLCFFVGVFAHGGRRDAVIGARYFFLVRECTEATAGAVAGESYASGGAGYLLDAEDAVVLACYYEEEVAASVEASMSANGVSVRVLEYALDRFTPSTSQEGEIAAIEQSAAALDDLTRMLYTVANGLERGEVTQAEASASLGGISVSLSGLAKGRAWEHDLSDAAHRAREIAAGIVFSKDVRYLQVQLCFCVLHLPAYFG